MVHVNGDLVLFHKAVDNLDEDNGKADKEASPSPQAGSAKLKHMDRVILGPCRVIVVYLERKLTPSEKASLTYQSAFREFMSGGDDASRLMMSPARQQLLDEVRVLAVGGWW